MKNKLKVLIMSCWALLLICVIFKLCGANWFIAMTNNKTFIDFCNKAQNSYGKYVICICNNVLSSSLYFMAVLKEKKPSLKWFIPYLIYALTKTFVSGRKKLFFILDIVVMIILPLLIKPKYIVSILVGFVLNIGFQLISMYLKRDNFAMFDDNLVVMFLLSIDYYIMLVLYYLYRNRKEE